MDLPGLITLLAIGYALFIGVCAWHIAGRLRRPPRRTYAWAVAKGLPGDPGELRPALAFEERRIEWRGVSIPVWDARGGAEDGPIVLLTPGWGDSRVGGLVRLRALAPLCSRVILWDPPGLGASEFAPDAERGRDREGAVSPPTRNRVPKRTPRWSMSTRDHEALLAVADELLGRAARKNHPARAEARGSEGADTPRDPAPHAPALVLFGWSAGAGASILAAESLLNQQATSRPASPAFATIAVIAEAPYRLPWTPARNVIRAAALPWFLCGPLAFGALGLRLGVGPRWRGFDRAAHAAALKGRVPTLILHGAADEVCPIQDGRDIAHAAGAQLVEIPGGRHNDLWVDPALSAASVQAVQTFLARL